MKPKIKTMLTLAVCTLFFNACKKEEHSQIQEQIVLKNNPDFRQFVAADILSRIKFSSYVSGKLNSGSYTGLKTELAVASETVLPVIFNKYQLDYGFFQKQVIDRLTKRVQVLQLLPAIAKLPEAQIDRLFQVGYQEVAEDLKLKINEKLKLLTAQNRGHKEMARVPFGHHTVKITGINTASIFEKNSYFTDYIEESISEDELVNQIAANIDIIVTYGALTPGEVWKCFKEAVGFGGSSMLGVVGWSRLSAGIQIQEMIALVSRWALRNLGWIGAAIAIIDFGDCMYNSLSK